MLGNTARREVYRRWASGLPGFEQARQIGRIGLEPDTARGLPEANIVSRHESRYIHGGLPGQGSGKLDRIVTPQSIPPGEVRRPFDDKVRDLDPREVVPLVVEEVADCLRLLPGDGSEANRL